MTIKRADVMGFCMGVRTAMSKAYRQLKASARSGEPVYTLGPLIHNPSALQELGDLGVMEISSPQEYTEGTVIIRAHGVAPAVRAALEAKGARIIDGTCPRVLWSQKIVEEFEFQNRQIIIAGDPLHGEVKALAGYASDVTVVENTKEADQIIITKPALLISQTTLDKNKYRDICNIISANNKNNLEIEIVNTICPATEKRQKALHKLLTEVDAIIVIGGKNSANTKNLYYTAVDSGKPAWHIEQADELPAEIFSYSVVGITAGASTPENSIQELQKALLKNINFF